MKKMRVAIIGQGRSGRNIHGQFFLNEINDYCQVVAVVEQDEQRRNWAKDEFNCDVYSDYTELFGRTDIDVVVNASFSHMHYAITKDLLQHKFNVLVEKPFSRTVYECMDLIHTAKENGVIVTAFHQSLYAPNHKKVKEVLNSGLLGEIYQISLQYSGFARRWDWQTLQSFCGGSVYNSGPHPVGQALDFLGWDKDVKLEFSSLSRNLTSGDANDCGKLILSALGKPFVDIEVNAVDAFAGQFTFKLFGKYGTMIANNDEYTIKYIDPTKLDEKPVIFESLRNPEGKPMYCSEKLDIITENAKIEGSVFLESVNTFYKQLYGAIMEGKPLDITPEKAAAVINIIEQVHADNPLSVEF
jgi:predicted dehydrogenase